MMKRHLPRGLDHRTRDQISRRAGQIREKRADTLVSTLPNEYGDHFAKGYRSDTHLGTVRDETGKSLHQLVKKSRGGYPSTSPRSLPPTSLHRIERISPIPPAARANCCSATQPAVLAPRFPRIK
jgi:hypothetical protein